MKKNLLQELITSVWCSKNNNLQLNKIVKKIYFLLLGLVIFSSGLFFPEYFTDATTCDRGSWGCYDTCKDAAGVDCTVVPALSCNSIAIIPGFCYQPGNWAPGCTVTYDYLGRECITGVIKSFNNAAEDPVCSALVPWTYPVLRCTECDTGCNSTNGSCIGGFWDHDTTPASPYCSTFSCHCSNGIRDCVETEADCGPGCLPARGESCVFGCGCNHECAGLPGVCFEADYNLGEGSQCFHDSECASNICHGEVYLTQTAGTCSCVPTTCSETRGYCQGDGNWSDDVDDEYGVFAHKCKCSPPCWPAAERPCGPVLPKPGCSCSDDPPDANCTDSCTGSLCAVGVCNGFTCVTSAAACGCAPADTRPCGEETVIPGCPGACPEGTYCEPNPDPAAPPRICDAGVCRNAPSTWTSFFRIKNPLAATSFPEFIDSLLDFVFYLSIAVVPVMLIIGAFNIMTSMGESRKYNRGKDIILYSLLGIAIIFLAKGLVVLIKSIIGASP